MKRWLWYSNAAIAIAAVLVLVLGLSHLAAMGPGAAVKGDKTSGSSIDEQNGSVTDLGNGQTDSPLVAITRQYSERWMPAQGSLRVTIGPVQALSAGPQWRVDNSQWYDSDKKVDNIAAGAHTVSFKPIDDWVIPEQMSVTIRRKQITEVSADYSPPPPVGALKVTLGPAAAVEAKAQWRVGKHPWQNSGAVLEKMPVGSQVVEFKQLTFWEAPQQLSVIITEDQLTEATADYIKKPTGFVQVTIGPNEVLPAKPQWREEGGAWKASGAKSRELLTGSCTIEFKAVAKWIAPEKTTVNIVNDQTTEVIREYVKQPMGSLQVVMGPSEALEAEAQWRVGGGAWQASGNVLKDLAIGSQTIEFKTLEGWNKPKELTVNIAQDEVVTATFNYSKPKPPPPNFTLEATLVIGQYQGLAWIKLPGKQKSQPVANNEKIEEYTVTRINHGSIELMREGHQYTLVVPEPEPESGKEGSEIAPAVEKKPPRRLPPVPRRPSSSRRPPTRPSR